MRLWTYHPPGTLIDRLRSVDPTQGPYWDDPITHRYKEALPRLCKMLGIRKYPLWCCTDPSAWIPIESRPVLEWELNVPESKIVEFIRETVWHAIICGQGDDWENVIVKERPIQPDRCI